MSDALRRGTCHVERVDPETFFPLDGDRPFEPGQPHPPGVEAALAYCRRCPVVAECLAYAFRHSLRYGVLGGTTGPERVALLRAARESEMLLRGAAKGRAYHESHPPRSENRRNGRCSKCRTSQHLRTDGMVVKHPLTARRPGDPCDGAGLPPLPEESTVPA